MWETVGRHRFAPPCCDTLRCLRSVVFCGCPYMYFYARFFVVPQGFATPSLTTRRTPAPAQRLSNKAGVRRDACIAMHGVPHCCGTAWSKISDALLDVGAASINAFNQASP